MKITVVSDQEGGIVSLGSLDQFSHLAHGVVEAGVVGCDGLNVNRIELPRELADRSLVDLHTSYKLGVGIDGPCLIRIADRN